MASIPTLPGSQRTAFLLGTPLQLAHTVYSWGKVILICGTDLHEKGGEISLSLLEKQNFREQLYLELSLGIMTNKQESFLTQALSKETQFGLGIHSQKPPANKSLIITAN